MHLSMKGKALFCRKKVANKTKQTNGTANDERAGIVQALDDDLSAGEDPKGGHQPRVNHPCKSSFLIRGDDNDKLKHDKRLIII